MAKKKTSAGAGVPSTGGRKVSKHEAFLSLAEGRANAVIDKLRILGNLADTRRYEFTEGEVEQMFQAILHAVEKTRNRFLVTNPLSDMEFKFEDYRPGE